MKQASQERKMKKGEPIDPDETELDIDQIAFMMDTFTFFASLIFIICFNAIFWSII